MLSSRRQRCAHWIALLAIWVAALAPTLSAAMAHAGVAGLDVCTAAGMQSLPAMLADGAGAADPAGELDSLDHCGYCLLAAHLAPPAVQAMPPVLLPVAPTDAVQILPPRVGWPAWALQPSRAPPSLN